MSQEENNQIKTNNKRKFRLGRRHLFACGLCLSDMFLCTLSYFAILIFRNDFIFSKIPDDQYKAWYSFIWIYCLIVLVVFFLCRLYRSVWKYASYIEAFRILLATVITGVLHGVLISVIFRVQMPISYYIGGPLLQFLLIVALRFSYRFIRLIQTKLDIDKKASHNVMVIGAGNAGQMIIRDIHTAKESDDRVRCIIDDDHNVWGREIEGARVIGGRDEILSCVKKYNIQKIYVAIPSATGEQKRDILNICNSADCEVSTLPSMYSIATGKVEVAQLKKVSIEDLLGRPPIILSNQEIYDSIKDKVILVTGGGGSIGSELCRQIAAHNPRQLIILDIYENNAYDIRNELKDKYPDLNLVVLIGSVRDSRRLNYIFSQYRPDYVYHAAAHKHVPLMEDSPCESIKNNAIGTYKTAYAAVHYGCKRFVLISTDKAVNPTNIMGASKRLCEMIIQTFAQKVKEGKVNELSQITSHMKGEEDKGDVLPMPKEAPTTQFVAVRFGNVLGSNGSVIPLFKKQIENGGPVTVTDKEIIRYFMTIPEAVSLVLTASTYAWGGEIFVLDMGTPMKIDDLARNLIRLAGYKPDVDIKIEYTGLRPGEKLFEEKLMEEEGLKKTKNDRIHIGKPIEFDYDQFIKDLGHLMEAAFACDPHIRELVEKVVVTYHLELDAYQNMVTRNKPVKNDASA